jgi:hypothetical protein
MTDDFHALTLAEARKQSREYSAKLRAVTDELAAILAARTAGRGAVPIPLTDRARKARERAKEMLNGHSPTWLSAPQSDERENQLFVEQDAIGFVLKALQDQTLVAEAAEAAAWAQANGKEWRALCREILLAAARLEALTKRAAAFVEGHVSAPLPLRHLIGDGAGIYDSGARTVLVHETLAPLTKAGLEEGIISATELRKAQNV